MVGDCPLLNFTSFSAGSDAVNGHTTVSVRMIIWFWSFPPSLPTIRQLNISLIIIDTETVVTSARSRYQHLPNTLLYRLLEVELDGEVA